MQHIQHPAPTARGSNRSEPPLSLRDLVEAICTGVASAQGIETMLDRIEGLK